MGIGGRGGHFGTLAGGALWQGGDERIKYSIFCLLSPFPFPLFPKSLDSCVSLDDEAFKQIHTINTNQSLILDRQELLVEVSVNS